MSKTIINQYYNNLDRAIQFGKSRNEQSIRTSFLNLLNEYARKQNYEVVAEVGNRFIEESLHGQCRNHENC